MYIVFPKNSIPVFVQCFASIMRVRGGLAKVPCVTKTPVLKWTEIDYDHSEAWQWYTWVIYIGTFNHLHFLSLIWSKLNPITQIIKNQKYFLHPLKMSSDIYYQFDLKLIKAIPIYHITAIKYFFSILFE